ncbi:MAG: NADH-quinone oxidoreductase subunit N, partial [Syntrophobacteraceae bacterium CG07_land_8_20_14_0_80_61_8]
SAVAVYYYLRVVIVMYSRAESPIALADRLGLGRIPSAALGALIVALWATLQIGILPQSLWELARHSVSALL